MTSHFHCRQLEHWSVSVCISVTIDRLPDQPLKPCDEEFIEMQKGGDFLPFKKKRLTLNHLILRCICNTKSGKSSTPFIFVYIQSNVKYIHHFSQISTLHRSCQHRTSKPCKSQKSGLINFWLVCVCVFSGYHGSIKSDRKIGLFKLILQSQ